MGVCPGGETSEVSHRATLARGNLPPMGESVPKSRVDLSVRVCVCAQAQVFKEDSHLDSTALLNRQGAAASTPDAAADPPDARFSWRRASGGSAPKGASGSRRHSGGSGVAAAARALSPATAPTSCKTWSPWSKWTCRAGERNSRHSCKSLQDQRLRRMGRKPS